MQQAAPRKPEQSPAPAVPQMWAALSAESLAKLRAIALASWKKAGAPKRPDFVMEGGMFYEGKWYARVDKAVSWKDAKAACEAVKGRLAVVHDAQTWEFVQLAGGTGWFWLGASDEAKPGEWRWVDGSAMSFSAWAGRQPDNLKGGESFLQAGFEGKWNVAPEDGKIDGRRVTHFLCEWGEAH